MPEVRPQQQPLTAEIEALDVIGSDYQDLFVAEVQGAADVPAERWARSAIEGAPAAGRFMAWRVLCGLSLTPSPENIGGWRIANETDGWIRLEASSRFMTANMIFLVDDAHVYFATLIRYDDPVGRLVWTPVSAVHRSIAPNFLRGGVKRVLRDLKNG